MKLNRLILCLCIGLFVALISCQPLPTGGPQSLRATVAIPTCQMDATAFVQSKVFFLSPTFNPQQISKYQAPSGTSVYNVQPYSNDIIAAYNAAPPYFREQLCGLDGVFIVQNNCSSDGCTVADVVSNSWGFREHPPQIAPGQRPKRFIATSQQLWQGSQAPQLSEYETKLLRYLLHWPARYVSPLYPPVFSNVIHDTRTMSVLATLAHEFGHVYWWDVFVPTAGGDINPSFNAFYATSWQNPPLIPNDRWLNFGDVSNNYHLSDDTNLTSLLHSILNGTEYYTATGDILHGIYSGRWNGKNADNGRWASALASFSTDEDFVETFQLNVLINANPPLTNLPLTIYRLNKAPVTEDVPANIKYKPVLCAKLAFVGPKPDSCP
jgi:hypothetical protein